MGRHSQITYWCHEVIRSQAIRGGVYIDATMGKGNDTRLLCELAGETGKVLAFDIQSEALEETEKLLLKDGIWSSMDGMKISAAEDCRESMAGYFKEQASRLCLVLDGHEHMDRYLEAESVDVICFNFGYLPGGDHHISTKTATSIEAVEKGVKLLRSGGMMSLCIYSGGDTGFDEKEALLAYLKTLPAREYTVIVNEYYNRENNPPMPVFVFKA